MHILIKRNAQKQTKQIKCEINAECGLVNNVFMDSGAMRDLEFICFSLIVIDGEKNSGVKKL